MKYIRLFEIINYDPLEYNPEYFTPSYYILKGFNETMVKVIDYDKDDVDGLPYYVEFIDGEISWMPAGKFKRYMTDEEIKDFEEKIELIKTAKKYNV